jgi:hypothetical protein
MNQRFVVGQYVWLQEKGHFYLAQVVEIVSSFYRLLVNREDLSLNEMTESYITSEKLLLHIDNIKLFQEFKKKGNLSLFSCFQLQPNGLSLPNIAYHYLTAVNSDLKNNGQLFPHVIFFLFPSNFFITWQLKLSSSIGIPFK